MTARFCTQVTAGLNSAMTAEKTTFTFDLDELTGVKDLLVQQTDLADGRGDLTQLQEYARATPPTSTRCFSGAQRRIWIGTSISFAHFRAGVLQDLWGGGSPEATMPSCWVA